jgi:hypothetical protein
MQPSNVLAVTLRLEATQTDEFQPILESMANSIDGLSNDIRNHITYSQNQLDKLKVK